MAVLVQIVLVPQFGTTFKNFATAIVVLLTITLAWSLRDRSATHDDALPTTHPPQES